MLFLELVQIYQNVVTEAIITDLYLEGKTVTRLFAR